MKTEIRMPRLNADMKDGMLARWNKQTGDAVQQGEILCEIETDKVVSEIEASCSGTVAQLCAQEGDRVPVGQVIAVVEG
ncbi:MAG: lipoyl domain-containing protein [Clostridia bacterium]|nr:lipoyl domain-containing protein [Clostridia bacterium]